MTLYIFPIGFKKPFSPIDFITNNTVLSKTPDYVKSFVDELILKSNELSENGIEELIFIPYSINLSKESRVKNADLIAAITEESQIQISLNEKISISEKDDAKEIKLSEDELFTKIYKLKYSDVIEYCKHNIEGFKQNNTFNTKMKEIKKNPKCHRKRYLDVKNQKGSYQDYYSDFAVSELEILYASV